MTKLSRRELVSFAASAAAAAAADALTSGCGGGGGTLNNGRISVGITPSELAAMATVANGLMSRFTLPAFSVTIARNGQIVYAQAFGTSNPNPTTGVGTISAQPIDLFRIASCTKPITATAIGILINKGYFKLTDFVFGDSLLGAKYTNFDSSTQAWVEMIRVEHLLNMQLGGWYQAGQNNTPYPDPVFVPYDSIEDMIVTTLATVPLMFKPGNNYGYSNFGYSLLGRIVEHVTNMSYSDAVQQLVLAPCGITDMLLGTNSRAPGEVLYFDPAAKSSPYAQPMQLLDSVGGWIATSTDLVRFLLHMDGYDSMHDLIQQTGVPFTLNEMVSIPAGQPPADQFTLGWVALRPGEWGHNGSLPGTFSAMEVNTNVNGASVSWAAVANSGDNLKLMTTDVEGTITQMMNCVSSWSAQAATR